MKTLTQILGIGLLSAYVAGCATTKPVETAPVRDTTPTLREKLRAHFSCIGEASYNPSNPNQSGERMRADFKARRDYGERCGNQRDLSGLIIGYDPDEGKAFAYPQEF